MPRLATPFVLGRPGARRTAPPGRFAYLAAPGGATRADRARLRVNKNTVAKWRKRYAEHSVEGLHDELRPGRPRTHDDDRVAEVINAALQSRPAHRTQWSVRAMEEHTGVSKSTVQRWFHLFGVQPHRQRTFKLSTVPFFFEKVRDIVGLYLLVRSPAAPQDQRLRGRLQHPLQSLRLVRHRGIHPRESRTD